MEWHEVVAVARDTRFADVRLVEETGSTNDDLVALARTGALEGAVLVADHQTAGRGRRGRRWAASRGDALLVSTLLRPEWPVELAGWAVAVVSIALRDACASVAGVDAELKWPNDLVVGDRKLAGVLAESVLEGDRLVAAVVGFGCNVGSHPEGLEATSLAAEAGVAVDRFEVLAHYLLNLDARYGRLDHDALRAEYRQRCTTLGRRVRVELDGATVVGTAVDVDLEGHLVVDTGGSLEVVAVGDVVHLRGG